MGPPPLVPGEDLEQYRRLQNFVADALQPRDIIDWLWVRDITDLEWEAIRLRKIKATLIGQHKKFDWETDKKGRTARVEGTVEQSLAYSLGRSIDVVERVDRMTMALELRRDRIYREFERRGAEYAARLRQAAEHIEDAEFREIAPVDSMKQSAA
jgi:hypothetical protein